MLDNDFYSYLRIEAYLNLTVNHKRLSFVWIKPITVYKLLNESVDGGLENG
jgi:hypothetical protein